MNFTDFFGYIFRINYNCLKVIFYFHEMYSKNIFREINLFDFHEFLLAWKFFLMKILAYCVLCYRIFSLFTSFFRFGIFSSIADYIIMNFVLAYLRRQFPNTPTMNTSDFSEIIKDNDNVLILDCRRPDEHKISKIPGAKKCIFVVPMRN